MERSRMVFSGSGGQGVITAAIFFAEAAVLHENLNAVQTQSYGPEARGGSTRSDVVISDSEIHFPKVQQPNVLVCLTQLSYNNFYPIIRPGGLLLSDPRFVQIQRKADARQIQVPMYQAVMKEIGKPIVFNICMLGTLIGLTGLLQLDSIMKVLHSHLNADYIAMNEKALRLGYELGVKAAE